MDKLKCERCGLKVEKIGKILSTILAEYTTYSDSTNGRTTSTTFNKPDRVICEQCTIEINKKNYDEQHCINVK